MVDTFEDSQHSVENLQLPRATGLSALLLSLVFHLSAFLCLALVVGRSRLIPEEPDRQVGIVIANRNFNQAPEYFHPAAIATAESDLENRQHERAAPMIEAEPPAALVLDDARPNATLPVDGSHSALDLATDVRRQTRLGQRPRLAPGDGDDSAIEEERHRLRRTLPTTPTAQLSLFGSAPAEGRSFVFLIDRSKSMGAGGLDAIEASQKELRSALQRLQSDHQFQIIVYNFKTLFLDERRLLPATDENKQRAEQFLEQFGGFGATDHEMAIQAALRLAPDVIYLLTDGGDPFLDDRQLTRIRDRSAGRVSIHCVQFGLGAASESSDFLRVLAAENNGGYQYVDRSRR